MSINFDKFPDITLSNQERIIAFIDALRSSKNVGDQQTANVRRRITRLARAEIRALKTNLTLSTTKTVLVFYRKVLRSVGESFAADALTLPDEDTARLRAQQLRQIHSDQSNLRPLIPDEYIERCLSCLTAPSFMVRALGIMGLSGRRSVEVLCLGRFSKSELPNHLRFEGQAKTREAEDTQQGPYDIPTLVSPQIVLAAWADLHAQRPDLVTKSPSQIHNGYTKELGKLCKREFGEDMSPKALRSAYAAIAYDRYADPSMSDTVYFSKILGHKLLDDETADFQTAQAYRDFYIPDQHKHALRGLDFSRTEDDPQDLDDDPELEQLHDDGPAPAL